MTNNGKFQRKLSEVEKFIESVLAKPMARSVKKKILDELQSYKAQLIARHDDDIDLPYNNLIRKKPFH